MHRVFFGGDWQSHGNYLASNMILLAGACCCARSSFVEILINGKVRTTLAILTTTARTIHYAVILIRCCLPLSL